jgi:branched-chain amino acid transport system substrate-binding protein
MTKETKVLWVVVVVAALALLGWYATTQKKSAEQPAPAAQEQQAEQAPIKVGFLHPLTGDAASYGEAMRNVAQLAVEEVNDAGGVNGRTLELVIEDGKCSGKDAANAMQKLVNVDQVKIVLGGFCSSESLAAVPIAETNKVALFSPGSSSPDLTGKSTFFMRNYPSDASQGSVLADEAAKKGWKKVAFVQEQLDYPLGIFKAFSAKFEQGGGVVVKEEFPTTTTDFRSILTKLKVEKPDALFIDSQTPASGERVLKQIVELKWTVPLLISDVFAGDAKTIEANKDALEGTLAAEFGVDENNTKFQNLAAAYKEKYGSDMPFQSYAQTEYDAVYMTRDALLAVGEDGELLGTWLRSAVGWEGASGAVTIGADGDRVGGHTVKVVKDGKVILLQE